jgi:hypothetical protein
MPVGLVVTTIEAAVRTATVRMLEAGPISASVASLIEGGIKSYDHKPVEDDRGSLAGGRRVADRGARTAPEDETGKLPTTQTIRSIHQRFCGGQNLERGRGGCQARTDPDGNAEYAALLSVERVRESMRTGIRSVEAYLDKMEQVNTGSKGHFMETAKPVFT